MRTEVVAIHPVNPFRSRDPNEKEEIGGKCFHCWKQKLNKMTTELRVGSRGSAVDRCCFQLPGDLANPGGT